ncbi:uncharacterized protein LOC136034258 [Artemia franciscana]|uniref:uncharacterized protein LOC136034258 n=1 Tax=Artemia franciscana TaxID=6661 RepID=UPI0032DA2D1B
MVPGRVRISAELTKFSLRRTLDFRLSFFSLLWQTAKFPKDWRTGTFVKLFKKGDAKEYGNYRGINLLSIPAKLFTMIILGRLQAVFDPHLREEQHGFRPKRSCADLIFTMRTMLEEYNGWRQSLYILFVDFEKVLDSVDRMCTLKTLKMSYFCFSLQNSHILIYVCWINCTISAANLEFHI